MFSLNPSNANYLNTLEFFFKLAGGIGAFYVFYIGLQRYKKDQIWKRSEFVAKEIKDFSSDHMVRNVMYMLDWGSRLIELFPSKELYNDRYVRVNRIILKGALEIHRLRKIIPGTEDRFIETETAIRDNFDHFLSYFERFEQFIEAGLISKKEISPYLNYWITTIAIDLEKDTKEVLFNFIKEYNFNNTQKLFERFGQNILPK